MKNSVTDSVLPRRGTGIKDYKIEEGEEDEDDGEKKDRRDEEDRTSLKIDLSMAEQFYYEVISSFEQEEVLFFMNDFSRITSRRITPMSNFRDGYRKMCCYYAKRNNATQP